MVTAQEWEIDRVPASKVDIGDRLNAPAANKDGYVTVARKGLGASGLVWIYYRGENSRLGPSSYEPDHLLEILRPAS